MRYRRTEKSRSGFTFNCLRDGIYRRSGWRYGSFSPAAAAHSRRAPGMMHNGRCARNRTGGCVEDAYSRPSTKAGLWRRKCLAGACFRTPFSARAWRAPDMATADTTDRCRDLHRAAIRPRCLRRPGTARRDGNRPARRLGLQAHPFVLRHRTSEGRDGPQPACQPRRPCALTGALSARERIRTKPHRLRVHRAISFRPDRPLAATGFARLRRWFAQRAGRRHGLRPDRFRTHQPARLLQPQLRPQ